MKRVLQVNKEIAGWLVIFFTLLSMAEGAKAQAPFDLKEYHTQKVLGTITASPHSTDQNKIILTVSVPKQFGITNIDGLRSLSSQSSGDHVIYSAIMDITEYNNLPSGKPFNAQVSLSDIEEPEDLVTIFNFYTPQSTRLSNNVVEVSSTVDPMNNNNAILKFTNPNKAITICLINDNDQIKFPINVEGGNLTIKRNQFSHTGFNLSTLKSGSLTLNNCTGSDLEMTGGTLTFDGSNSTWPAGPFVTNLSTKGGTINYNNSDASQYITNMTIEGVVNINGENQFDGDDLGKGGDYIHFADKITINSGAVTMNKVGLHKNGDVIINNGDVTMEKCAITHTSYNSSPASTTPCILQNGGTLLIKDGFFHASSASNRIEPDHFIEVANGTLTVENGYYDFGAKSFIHVIGAKATVNVKDGYLGNPQNFAAIYQKEGSVEIAGGEFLGAICIESGDLTIAGGEFVTSNTLWNDNNAHIHILGNTTNVSLKGGHYGRVPVYAAPELSIQPESLLASGFGLYTWDQQWQPDVSLSADHLISGQENKHIKSLSAPSTPNNLLEAAKTASVGTEGTDVKVIPTGEEYANWQPCELEINTAKGLAWFASGFHTRKDNTVDNGGKYRSGAEVVRLTADIDMSEYDWIPTSFSGKFDGLGHCISGLKVNQSDAAFLSYVDRDAILANLVIRGTFNSIRTDYTSSWQQAAGLCLRNDGLIINCGVQQSTVSCVTTDRINVQVGGLVASNYGTIRNCYMTGDVTCEASHEDRSYPINYAYHHYIGGLVGDNWSGGAYNCYHADGAVNHTGANLIAALRIYKDDLVQKNESSSEVIKENCTTTPSLDALNQQVQIFNAALEGGAIAWSTWVTENGINGGHPIHVYEKDTPSIIETQIALLVKGDGELEATYFIKNDDPDKEPVEQTIKADTTVNIRNLVAFKITAKPGKGIVLDSVTSQQGGQAPVKLDEIKTNEPFDYDVSFLSATITAYFHTVTLYVDENTPLIGGTNEEEEVEHVNISGVGTSDNPVEKEVGNVKVTTQEGTTTIADDSNVILNLSGTSNLGKLINEGTVIIKKIKDEAALEVTEVVNKGTFSDETGVITEVKDDTGNALLLLDGSTGDEVEEGQKATLTAKATVSEGATVTFLWQFLDEAESKWTNVPKASTKAQTRSVRLRASTNSREDKYETGTLTKDAPLQYRCLITTVTPANEAEGTPPVSTTLTTYTEVTIKSDPGTNPDPAPTPTPEPSYTYYEVTLPEVTGATMNPAAGKHIVKEGAPFSFTLTLDADYNQSKPEVKAGNEVLVADVNGKYTIENVRENQAITITGITLNNPTANAEVKQSVKVWSKGDVLYLYSSRPTMAHVAGINGQLWKSFSFSGSVEVSGLPHGSYIVRIGHDIFKIIH